MSSLSLYEHFFSDRSGASSNRQLTIVLHGSFNDHEVLARSLATYLRGNAAPEKIVIFGTEEQAVFINEALSEKSAFGLRIGVAWGGTTSTKLFFGIILKQGASSYAALGIDLSNAEILSEVHLAGTMAAQEIFKNSKCLQVAPRGSHYSKTSKAHSNSFIRTSNALVKSQNTLTLAYFLQLFVAQPAKRILIDTSAIASVVYAACHIAVQSGSLAEIPIIDSFQSYEGLSDADLEDVDNTLFVISASTSGNLARKAFEKGVGRSRLITLYLLSNDQADQFSLCTLRRHEKNPDGLATLESWSETDCILCQNGSAAIQLGGDLFLTAMPETVSVNLIKKHLPDEQRDVISRFAGLQVFRAHRRVGERTSEISVDLEPVFSSSVTNAGVSQFKEDWARLLRRHVPANLTHIIHPNYPYAATLAEGISSYGMQFIKENLVPVSGNDLATSVVKSNGCAVVVGPCVDDPIELMGINRDLRAKIPGGTATYLFPFVRAASQLKAKGIVTNLTFGDRGANTYSFYNMFNLAIPEDRTVNPWDKELRCLKALVDWIEEVGEEVPNDLLERRKLLNEGTANGLTGNLFWPDSAGVALKIRSNFVLLPTSDGTRVLDQADIFVVISALLNNVRQIEGPESLQSTQYQRKVISPGNFLRFNDGVIQAALLRAARAGELNYAATEDGADSSHLTEHLLSMVNSADTEAGEALTEFMLAIAVGALRLEERDLNRVIASINVNLTKVPIIVSLLGRGIENKILPIQ